MDPVTKRGSHAHAREDSILARGTDASYPNRNPLADVLDHHKENGKAFKKHIRLSTDEGSLSLPYWLLNLDETVGLLVGKTEYAATSQSNIVINALLSDLTASATSLGLDPT